MRGSTFKRLRPCVKMSTPHPRPPPHPPFVPAATTITPFPTQVLNGESWVIVDGAVLDVFEFSLRHPGGARVVMNAIGTDVTGELLGEDRLGGTFSPHIHTEVGRVFCRNLVLASPVPCCGVMICSKYPLIIPDRRCRLPGSLADEFPRPLRPRSRPASRQAPCVSDQSRDRSITCVGVVGP